MWGGGGEGGGVNKVPYKIINGKSQGWEVWIFS